MVKERNIKNNKEARQFLNLFDKEDNNLESEKSSEEVSGDFFHAHNKDMGVLPRDVSISAPNDIHAFQQSILKIPGYSVELLNNGSFVVSKTEGGKKVEVLKGNKDTCQMSYPLDKNVLNAYIEAHKGKDIIVDRCKTKEAAQQLLDACKNSKPPVGIKFPAGKLEELGFDTWTCSKHSSPPKSVEPDIDVAIKPHHPGRNKA